MQRRVGPPEILHTNVGWSNSTGHMGSGVPDRRGVDSRADSSSAPGRRGPPPSGADYGVTDFDPNARGIVGGAIDRSGACGIGS